MRHPFKNFVIWEQGKRSWLPALIGIAFLIFMVAELFDPGCRGAGC